MKLYKVHEYDRRDSGENLVPIHYYMIFRRSIKTLFRWRWNSTVYSKHWLDVKMKNKKYTMITFHWRDGKWSKE